MSAADVRPEGTAEFYLAGMRTDLALSLTQRVEHKNQLVDEVIRKQQELASAEARLREVAEEVEGMAAALEQMPPPPIR